MNFADVKVKDLKLSKAQKELFEEFKTGSKLNVFSAGSVESSREYRLDYNNEKQHSRTVIALMEKLATAGVDITVLYGKTYTENFGVVQNRRIQSVICNDAGLNGKTSATLDVDCIDEENFDAQEFDAAMEDLMRDEPAEETAADVVLPNDWDSFIEMVDTGTFEKKEKKTTAGRKSGKTSQTPEGAREELAADEAFLAIIDYCKEEGGTFKVAGMISAVNEKLGTKYSRSYLVERLIRGTVNHPKRKKWAGAADREADHNCPVDVFTKNGPGKFGFWSKED